MKLTIESTSQIVEINGGPGRVWIGRTEGGVECFVVVAAIAVRHDADQAEFERDLYEREPLGVAAILQDPRRQ